MTTNTRRNLLRRAANLVVVDDGAYMWVGSRQDVYDWLIEHDIDRGFDRSTNLPNVAAMDADTYQSMCDDIGCITATHGGAGDYVGDPHDLIEAILARNAAMLYIR